MSGYVCPCCDEVSYIFSSGGGQALAEREGLRFLGRMPVDVELVTLLDASRESAEVVEGMEGINGNGNRNGQSEEGFDLLRRYQKTPSWPLFKDIVDRALAIENENVDPTTPAS